MWKKPEFLSQGLLLEAPCHHVMLTTATYFTGWGVTMSESSAQDLWGGPIIFP